MHWTRRHSRGRPPHPDVLTPAEWRVLELVREGKTNAEIAIDLGVTIPTVKTHVSRIFTKTDTANRQELSGWDGAPSDASRAALSRGFAAPLLGWLGGGTATKTVAIGAAGAVLVGAVALMYVAFGSDSIRGGAVASSQPLVGYYMESSTGYGAPSDQPQPNIDRSGQSIARRWHVDEFMWRVESHSTSFDVMLSHSAISVADGDEVLYHDLLGDKWARFPNPIPVSGMVPSFLGPAPGDDIDAVIAALEEELEAEVVHAGTAEVLGREVQVLEFHVEDSVHRISVDPAALVVLLQEFVPGEFGRPLRFEVTRFDPQISMDRDLFDLAPPPDADVHENVFSEDGRVEFPDCPASGEPVQVGAFYAYEGLLLLEHTPEEWTGAGSTWRQSAGTCDVTGLWAGLRPVGDPEGAYIFLDQARIPSGIPHWLALGDPVDVAGHEGYRTTEDNTERLIWQQGDIVALLEGRDAPFEELLRIAESAYIVTDVPPASIPTPAATPPGTTTPQATAPAP